MKSKLKEEVATVDGRWSWIAAIRPLFVGNILKSVTKVQLTVRKNTSSLRCQMENGGIQARTPQLRILSREHIIDAFLSFV